MYRTGRYSEGDLSKIFQAVTKLEEFFEPILFVARKLHYADSTAVASSSYDDTGRKITFQGITKFQHALKNMRELIDRLETEEGDPTHPHEMLLGIHELLIQLDDFTAPHHQKGNARFDFEHRFRYSAKSISQYKLRDSLKINFRGEIPAFFEDIEFKPNEKDRTKAYIDWLGKNARRTSKITRKDIQELRTIHQSLADIIHKDIPFERVVSKQDTPLP